MSVTELSEFASEKITPRLDGIEGVAGVTPGGIVTESIRVVLDDALIESKNKEITAAIDRQFEESEQELTDAREELEKSRLDTDEGLDSIKDGKSALGKAQKELSAQLAAADRKINEQEYALIEAKLQLTTALAELTGKKTELETNITATQTGIDGLEQQKADAETALAALTALSDGLAQLDSQREALISAAMAADPSLTRDAAIAYLTANSPEFAAIETALADIDAQLSAKGLVRADLPNAIATATAGVTTINTNLAALSGTLTQINTALGALNANIAKLNGTLSQLSSGETGIEDARAQLAASKAAADYEMYEKLAEIVAGEQMLGASSAQLDSAEEQIEGAEEQIEDAKQSAYDSADLGVLLTKSMLSDILFAQNFSMPAGYADENGESWLVSVGDSIADIDELRSLTLLDLDMDGLDPIKLSDVATAETISDADGIYAKMNGVSGVLYSFRKQSGFATATASENISETLDKLTAEYPGISFTALMDQGDYIHIVINSVLENLLLGAVLAIVILFFFLWDIRPTFIVALSIPVSVTFAVVLMYFLGVTLNVISLAGLAVGVGMLVDNSIVAIENIFRLRTLGFSPFKAAISGAGQVTGALIASTLTTVCVFLPIVFLQGITRQLFQDLALTIAYSLLASLIIALTLVPAMASGVLRKNRTRDSRLNKGMKRVYGSMLGFTMKHKVLTLVFSALLLALTVVLSVSKGFTFMPSMESTQIMANITLDEDNTLADTAEVCDAAAADIAKIPGVSDVGVMQSSGLAGVIGLSSGSGSSNEVTMYAVLEGGTNSGGGEIEQRMNEIFAAHGIEDYSISGTSSAMTGSALTSSGLAYTVYGTDIADITEAARMTASALEGVDGIEEISDGIDTTSHELVITVDKDAAMSAGFTVAEVYASVSAELSTATLTNDIDGKSVTVTSEGTDEITTDDIRSLVLTKTSRTDGTRISTPISDIADISEGETLASISRQNQKRCLTVTASVADGHNVTLTASDAAARIEKLELPGDTYLIDTGENDTIMSSLGDLVLMLLLGVVIVYLIMVAQFQSLLSPLIVMFTIPLAATGGLAALLIANMEISVVAMIGLVMLVGIIVNNGIVLIDYMNTLRKSGAGRREAVTEACLTRLRPVLMTALTTILGLIPMAFAIGTGASLVQPIAVTCIGGLIYATFMTLFVIPILYDSLCKRPPRVVTKEELEIADD